MGEAIKSDAAVSLLILLLLILDNFWVSLHRPPISSTASSWVQVCSSNRSVSRRCQRHAAFVISSERLLSSQCAFCLLSPLWLPGTCESSRSLWTVTPPSPTVATGLLRGSSRLRGMSQVPQQGVKRAAEVNKSRAYERLSQHVSWAGRMTQSLGMWDIWCHWSQWN